MHDVFIVALFFTMILTPCVIALHATLGEEDFSLGYATSYRHAKAWLIETFRI